MKRLFFFLLGLVTIAAGVVLILRIVLYDVAQMDNLDMWPTCGRGAWMLVNRRAEPQRGDLIVFVLPEKGLRVRRVIAISGDKVAVRGGVPVVNGVPEETTRGRGSRARDVPERTVTGFFVMADNREHAADSREYGPVARQDVRGVVQMFFSRGMGPQ